MQTISSKGKFCFPYFLEAATNVFKVKYRHSAVAMRNCKSFNRINNHMFVVAACVVLFFCSCQKEQLRDDTVVNNTALAATTATAKKSKPVDGSSGNYTNYGALIGAPSVDNWLNFQVGVADQLGISCLRGSTLVPCIGRANSLLNTNYNVLLNFNSSINNRDEPAPFITDLIQYKIDLSNTLLLNPVKPIIAVIENEEANRFFYSGSASEYIRQLNAAIDVMHAYGIKVANGGITATGLNYLVYQDFLAQGKEDSAKMFQQLTHVAPNNPITQDRGNFVDTLLQAYVQSELDYINFHWKGFSPDTEAMKEVIAYLKKRTSKPIISNELGQFDKDPDTLLAMMQLCDDQRLSYVLWYSPDENDSKRAYSLQYDDGTLTPSGVAYQNYLAN